MDSSPTPPWSPTPDDDPRSWRAEKDLARDLGIHLKTLQKLRRTHRLPHQRVTERNIRYTPSQIAQLKEALACQDGSPEGRAASSTSVTAGSSSSRGRRTTTSPRTPAKELANLNRLAQQTFSKRC